MGSSPRSCLWGKRVTKFRLLRAWIPAEAEQVERDQREPCATLANPVLQDPKRIHKWEPGCCWRGLKSLPASHIPYDGRVGRDSASLYALQLQAQARDSRVERTARSNPACQAGSSYPHILSICGDGCSQTASDQSSGLSGRSPAV